MLILKEKNADNEVRERCCYARSEDLITFRKKYEHKKRIEYNVDYAAHGDS